MSLQRFRQIGGPNVVVLIVKQLLWAPRILTLVSNLSQTCLEFVSDLSMTCLSPWFLGLVSCLWAMFA